MKRFYLTLIALGPSAPAFAILSNAIESAREITNETTNTAFNTFEAFTGGPREGQPIEVTKVGTEPHPSQEALALAEEPEGTDQSEYSYEPEIESYDND